ncbi:class I SAM-dependent methyltransferase [Dokdonella sp.]|uniref:class I SAM-dependent methyltransferase n=1 Tax=Dokdonella sp. TaxID=2291710 RepID=UPI003784493F
MQGYATRNLTLSIGGHDYQVRSLSDRQQFADPQGDAERAGISSAQWALFGQPWPSGHALAETMSAFAIDGKRILELGCGLGLSSLVLQRREADITASDHHPLAESFLEHNAALNDLTSIRYRDLPWNEPDATLGRFDVIIASDVLYERGHAAQLAGMMQRHAQADAEIVLSDPGRGNSASFTRAMKAQGYAVDERRQRFEDTDIEPFRGRVIHYRRDDASRDAQRRS